METKYLNEKRILKEGADAWRDGIPLDDNPYIEGGRGFELWEFAWKEEKKFWSNLDGSKTK